MIGFELTKIQVIPIGECHDTAIEMTQAADQVTEGLSSIFDLYGKDFDKFSVEALEKVKQLVHDMQSAFKNINLNFDAFGLTSGMQSNSYDYSKSVTLNDYGTKNFTSQSDSYQYWLETSNLAVAGLSNRL